MQARELASMPALVLAMTERELESMMAPGSMPELELVSMKEPV
jgi:hypothetical protein